LLIYCNAGLFCHHSAVIDADRWPDETVLLDLDRRAVCTKCGIIGADVRPNWQERAERESLTAKSPEGPNASMRRGQAGFGGLAVSGPTERSLTERSVALTFGRGRLWRPTV
jgi:hypothetical protein